MGFLWSGRRKGFGMSKHKLVPTGYKDYVGDDIIEGDILVGLTDGLHPKAFEHDMQERDFVKWNYWNPHQEIPEENGIKGEINYWNWNGHNLKSVAGKVKKVGSIFTNPELLLNIDQRKQYENGK